MRTLERIALSACLCLFSALAFAHEGHQEPAPASAATTAHPAGGTRPSNSSQIVGIRAAHALFIVDLCQLLDSTSHAEFLLAETKLFTFFTQATGNTQNDLQLLECHCQPF